MKRLDFDHGTYHPAERPVQPLFGLFPSFFYYAQMLDIVCEASLLARRSQYGDREWSNSSFDIIKALESVGTKIHIEGVDNFADVEGPCVFVGNHMSTLETFVLPTVISPSKPVTFVIKRSLVEYPVFKHIMRSRNPVVVDRVNPREDFKTVMEEGQQRLESGVSLVVFPQTTRTTEFDPARFNTIGVKLAKRTGVPVVPFALKTDAWGSGKRIKDFGPIDPRKSVHFAFGEPLRISGAGQQEQQAIVGFIQEKLRQWQE